MERRGSGLNRAVRRVERCGCALVLGSRADVPYSGGTLRDSRELLAYAVLGIVGGFASLLFAKSLGYLRPMLRRQPAWVADASTGCSWPSGRCYWLLWLYPGDGLWL